MYTSFRTQFRIRTKSSCVWFRCWFCVSCVCARARVQILYIHTHFIFEFILDFKSMSINYSNLVFIISVCVCASVCLIFFSFLPYWWGWSIFACCLIHTLTHSLIRSIWVGPVRHRHPSRLLLFAFSSSRLSMFGLRADFFWSEEFN